MKKTLLLLFAGAAIFRADAQKTLSNEDPVRYYNRGLDLYDKEKYGSAIKEFQAFLEISKDPLLVANAKFYRGASAIELNHADGLALLQSFISEYPESHKISDANFKIGSYHLRHKEYRHALRHFMEADPNLLSPADAEACYFGRGYCYYQTGKFAEARKDLKPLLNDQNGKYYTQANYYYGYMAYKEGDYDEALKSFEKIANREIKIVKLYIAQIHYAQGHYSRVIDMADSLEFEAARKPGRFLVGKSHYQLNQYDQALPYFQGMENQDSLLPAEIYQIAYTYLRNKKYTEAYQTFSKIAMNETAIGQMASYNLAEAFLELDKKSSARNAFYQASRTDFDPKVKEVSAFNYAKLSFELSFQQEALASLQAFIDQYPGSQYNDDAKGLLAELMLSTKNYKDAVAVLETISRMSEQTKAAYQKITYYRGEELYLNKEFEEAANFFNKSLKYTPDRTLQALSHFWLAEVLYKKNQYNSAIESYNKFLDFSESSKTKFKALAYYNLGYCYFKKQDFPMALNYFQKFIEMGSERRDVYVDAQLRLADCYFISRKYDKALDVYSYVTAKAAPGSDYAYFQRATILGLTGQYNQKIAELQAITEKYPNSMYVDAAVYELANVYQQKEFYKDAIRYFNYLIADYSGSKYVIHAWGKLGLVYLAMDDDEKALYSFKKVVELYPETKQADEAIDLIGEIYTKRAEADKYFEYLKSLNRLSISAVEQDSILYFSAYNRYNTVSCATSIGDFEKYLKMFEGGRHAIQAHYYKAECEYKEKQYDKALIDYQYVLNQPGEFAERAARQTAWTYYLHKKDYWNALTYYVMLENLSRNKENYQTAVIGQMKSLLKLNKIEEGYQAAVKVLRSDYTNTEVRSEAHYIMGTYDLGRYSLDSALIHFKYVEKVSKNALGAEAAYNIALVYFKQSNFDETERIVLEIKDKYSAYGYWVAKSFILMADVFVKRGDTFEAQSTLQSILDNYKSEDDDIRSTAKEKLAQIR